MASGEVPTDFEVYPDHVAEPTLLIQDTRSGGHRGSHVFMQWFGEYDGRPETPVQFRFPVPQLTPEHLIYQPELFRVSFVGPLSDWPSYTEAIIMATGWYNTTELERCWMLRAMSGHFAVRDGASDEKPAEIFSPFFPLADGGVGEIRPRLYYNSMVTGEEIRKLPNREDQAIYDTILPRR